MPGMSGRELADRCYHAIHVGLPAVAGQLGATCAIPVVYGPALMITHGAPFYLLVRARLTTGRALVGHATAFQVGFPMSARSPAHYYRITIFILTTLDK
jgi:hypothetical protein